MKKNVIQFVQARLNSMGLDAGPEDGVLGPRSLAALDRTKGIPSDWSKNRKAVAFIQLLAKKNEIETGSIDGYWGPQTEYAFEVLQQVLVEQKEPEIWRPEDLPDENPHNWPRQEPQDNLIRFFGKVGENQTRIELPYPHRLSWNKSKVVNGFQCHEKVHDSMHRVLTRVLEHYGLDMIRELRLDLWGGCLNVRKMRGGAKYSMHSWGIASDYDPDKNQLKWGRDRATYAKSEYNSWWRLWEEEGWISLGRTRNFDWMHIQAAKL
jgi:hypothetical protein